VINIESELTGSEKIGVWRAGRGIFTKNYGKFNDDDPTTRFYSQNVPDYEVDSVNTSDGLEGDLFCYNNALNWSYVVQLSIDTRMQQTFTLYDNWTAASNGSYATAFGTDGYYWYGGLRVNSGANVKLNLNGYTLDRALTSARDYGWAIRVDSNAKLEIVDELLDTERTTKGTITGGKNSRADYQSAGAIMVYSNGELTLNGGLITGNVGNMGAVSIYSARINLGGSVSIKDNKTNSNVNSNLYLQTEANYIGITSKLTGGDPIGVTHKAFGALTRGYGQSGNAADPATVFISEDVDYGVRAMGEGDELEAETFTFKASIAWEHAIKTSLANGGRAELCTLYQDWTAAYDGSYRTAFGYDGTYYYYGSLYVPTGAHVILDLNGHTVNRNITGSAYSRGYVFYVNGTLEINDTSKDIETNEDGSKHEEGKITGGNCSNAGAAYV
ncbi:MAG: hypothetical protein K2L87_00220, partial [Clostridiales bacterium]|nr:hypothetical protein [Clostridiales bacterium]